MTFPDDHFPDPAAYFKEEAERYRARYAALVPVVNMAIYNLRKGRLTKAQVADRLEQLLVRTGS